MDCGKNTRGLAWAFRKRAVSGVVMMHELCSRSNARHYRTVQDCHDSFGQRHGIEMYADLVVTPNCHCQTAPRNKMLQILDPKDLFQGPSFIKRTKNERHQWAFGGGPVITFQSSILLAQPGRQGPFLDISQLLLLTLRC